MNQHNTEFASELNEIAAGRIPAVICPGITVAQVKEYIPDLSPHVFWCGVPKWWYVERELLAPHNEQICMVWTGCNLTLRSEIDYVEELVNRDKKSLLVTTKYGLSGLTEKPELVQHKNVWVSDFGEQLNYNALGGMFLTLMTNGFSSVLVVGCDGKIEGDIKQFGQDEYEEKWDWYSIRTYDIERVAQELLDVEKMVSGWENFNIVNIAGSPIWEKIPTMAYHQIPDLSRHLNKAEKGEG